MDLYLSSVDAKCRYPLEPVLEPHNSLHCLRLNGHNLPSKTGFQGDGRSRLIFFPQSKLRQELLDCVTNYLQLRTSIELNKKTDRPGKESTCAWNRKDLVIVATTESVEVVATIGLDIYLDLFSVL
ncbi:hypothetical protein Syun_012464 [Stephania yunnanensis]|uniref:Uncharacterized protein n=1 Tax=Stephania yunnanensis TaxID=152371 RepID=A0AAP0PHI8_9MAGN